MLASHLPLAGFGCAAVFLLATACGGSSESATHAADAGSDSGPSSKPVDVSELPGTSFVFVGVQSDMALLVRGGGTQTMIAVRGQGGYLFGVESAWSWHPSAASVDAVDPCTWRDDDGVAASPGAASGQVELSGSTSARPADPASAWSGVATGMKAALLSGKQLSAPSLIGGAGLDIGMHTTGQYLCSYPTWGPDGATGAFDGAALAGTEGEAAAWWSALKPLVPAP